MPADLHQTQRDLQRKIDKARPLMKLYESGELKVLSESEQATVAAFPQWEADLAEVKRGVLPQRPTNASPARERPRDAAPQPAHLAAAAAEAAMIVGAAVASPAKSGKQLKRERAMQRQQHQQHQQDNGYPTGSSSQLPANEHARGHGRGGAKNGTPATAVTDPEEDRALRCFFEATGKTRAALIDAHVASQINKSEVQALTKEFDQVASLRRDILTGRITNPTKVQEARVLQADSLKKELTMAQEKVKLQSDRLKATIMARLDELQEEAAAAAVPPPPPPGPAAAKQRGGGGRATSSVSSASQRRESVNGGEEEHSQLEEEEEPEPEAPSALAGDEFIEPGEGPDGAPEQHVAAGTAAEQQQEYKKSDEEDGEAEVVAAAAAAAAATVGGGGDGEPAAAGDETLTPSAPQDSDALDPAADAEQEKQEQEKQEQEKQEQEKQEQEKQEQEKQEQEAQNEVTDEEKQIDTAEDAAEAAVSAPSPPSPPPEPKKPIVLDWTAVEITRNRPRLNAALSALRALSPPARGRTAAGDAGGAVAGRRSASAAVVGSRAARSTSPLGRLAPPGQTRRDPAHIEMLVFDGARVPPPPVAPEHPQGKAAGTKKGATNNSASSKGTAASSKRAVVTPFQQTAVSRLQRDLALCRRDVLPFVAVTLAQDSDIFAWAINVAPVDGPLAGTIVPLECRFSELYPQVPPVVRSLVDIPHPSIVTLDGQRNVLCMPHTDPKEWSPACGVFSILQQLQIFFSAEAFGKARKAAPFRQSIAFARGDLARLRTSWGHTAATPVPPVPYVNGPLHAAADAVRPSRSGAATLEAAATSGSSTSTNKAAVWRHAYGGAASALFRFTIFLGRIEARDELFLGVVTDPNAGDLTRAFFGVSTKDGSITARGQRVGSLGCPLQSADEVEFSLGFAAGKSATLRIAVARVPVVECRLSDHVEIGHALFHPAIIFAKGAGSAGMVCHTTTSQDADTAPTTAAPPAAAAAAAADDEGGGSGGALGPGSGPAAELKQTREDAAAPRCFVTLAGEAEAILGVGLHVVHHPRTQLPLEVHVAPDFISETAFKQLTTKRAPSGGRIECFLPLPLHAPHAAAVATLLPRYISLACRNPNASTLYSPPFRAVHAALLFPLALSSITAEVARSPLTNVAAMVRLYAHVLHAFVVSASASPAVVAECARQAPNLRGAAVLALSCVLQDLSWRQLVCLALLAELPNATAHSTDEQLLGMLGRPARKALLIAAAFARATNVSPLERAVEMFTDRGGAPTPEMVAEVDERVVTHVPSVRTWEDLCGFLGVNVYASDIVGAAASLPAAAAAAAVAAPAARNRL